MDWELFDGLTRILGTAPGRRALLRAVAGFILGIAGLRLTGDQAAGRRRRVCFIAGQGCHHDRQCCSGKCTGQMCRRAKRRRRRRRCRRHQIRCGGRCINPRQNRHHCGACNQACASNQTCDQGSCVDPSGGAGDRPRTVFLSSSTQNGDLGGINGANATCTTLANNAGLPGTYKAWLSDSTSSPAETFTRSTAPYQLVTGVMVAQNWADLTDGSLAHPISVTELGDTIDPDDYVWTNTAVNGTREYSDPVHYCGHWQTTLRSDSQIGVSSATNGTWTKTGTMACTQSARLYCFQQS